MNQSNRKLYYLVGIIVLYIPVIYLGRPSSPKVVSTGEEDLGGYLAQMRKQYELGATELGAVDPSSATMNLLLLGLRGPAANYLWIQHEKHKEMKDWAQMEALTESIVRLQPHFIKVWKFHGHNLSYNVAAEWDQVADRFHWVKRGVKFQMRGQRINEKHPELYWDIGHVIGQKINKADEWRQYRTYFLRDPDAAVWADSEIPGPDIEINPNGIDNNLVAHTWYTQAVEREDAAQYFRQQHIMAPVLFRSYPSRAKFDFALMRQKEGRFDEVTRAGWAEAYQEWVGEKFGSKDQPAYGGLVIRLEWSNDDIKAITTDRNEIAQYKDIVNRYQDMCNYRYWRQRALAERQSNTLEAHRAIYLAEQELKQGNTDLAETYALEGLTKLEKMVADYPSLLEDETTEEGLLAHLYWRACLRTNGKEVPEEYPLKDLWMAHQNEGSLARVKDEMERRLSPSN